MEASRAPTDWRQRGFSGALWTDPPGQVGADFVHPVDERLLPIEGEIERTVQGAAYRAPRGRHDPPLVVRLSHAPITRPGIPIMTGESTRPFQETIVPVEIPVEIPGESPVEAPGAPPLELPGERPLEVPGEGPVELPDASVGSSGA